ncbi:MAG: hypothetical protein AAGC74_06290 [Verrucomicrobiota bacterium]
MKTVTLILAATTTKVVALGATPIQLDLRENIPDTRFQGRPLDQNRNLIEQRKDRSDQRHQGRWLHR